MKKISVLFVGNSYTYFNDMPHMFAEICRSSGADVEVTMLTHGGKGWDFHVDEPEVPAQTDSTAAEAAKEE